MQQRAPAPPAVSASPFVPAVVHGLRGRWRRRSAVSDAAVLRLNLLLFLFSGVMGGFWIWRNTGFAEEFAALLTLGGGLSWLAFALHIIPEEKTKAVQAAFYGAAFENRGAVRWQIVGFAAVLVVTSAFATVQISPLRQTIERPVVVCSAADGADASDGGFWARHIAAEDFDLLQPGHDTRVVVPVWWGLARRFVVAVDGYPEKTVTLHPWQRVELIAPTSFRRTVLLLKPTSKMIATCQLARRTLVVTRLDRSAPPAMIPFDGHAVWIGCDARVEVPPAWRDTWEKEKNWPEHMAFLLFPTAAVLPGGELAPAERIDVRVIGPGGKSDWNSAVPVVVAANATQAEFTPQLVDVGDKQLQ